MNKSEMIIYKKVSQLILPVLAIGIFICGCSRKENKVSLGDSADSDSSGYELVEAISEIREVPMTSEGVGGITVGMKVADIPAEKEGVYDQVISEEGYESNSYIFFYEGVPLFTALEFTPGTIDMISADSPLVTVEADQSKSLRLGDEFSELLSLPGVEVQWESADGEGMWCWRWNGLWFQPDQSHLPEAFSKALYNEAAPPATSLIIPEVKIGFIGTGLPW